MMSDWGDWGDTGSGGGYEPPAAVPDCVCDRPRSEPLIRRFGFHHQPSCPRYRNLPEEDKDDDRGIRPRPADG